VELGSILRNEWPFFGWFLHFPGSTGPTASCDDVAFERANCRIAQISHGNSTMATQRMPTNPNHLTFEISSPQSYPTLHGDCIDARQERSVPKVLRIHPVDSGAALLSIDSDEFTFGRGDDCNAVVREDSASRKHAKIIRKGEKWFLVDLGSTNGTWINEERIQNQQLNSGDRIRIGRWTFKFFDENNVEAHYHESVYQMMTQDALTGAWNKRYLKDVLEREVLRHRRSKLPLGLLMIDFDRFKAINDDHGHLVGDEILSEFGKRICDAKRASEVFARFGGDEFTIVLVNSDYEASRLAAERLMAAVVSEPFQTSEGTFDCTFSSGFAVCLPGDNLSADELLEAADQKLYEAKDAGRNQIIG